MCLTGAGAAFADAPGGLVAVPGAAGCVANAGAGGCTGSHDLPLAQSIVISPDGANAYVSGSNALLTFDRNPASGQLVQKAGTDGCLRSTASATCRALALSAPTGLAIAPNGR